MIWFGNPGLLYKLNSYRIWGWVFCLILLFLDLSRCFRLVWLKRVCKSIPLMPVFFKALLSVLLFPYYAFIILLMMLSVTLPSMLMILLSILSVIRLLNCSNSYSWLLNLNLTSVTLWTRVGLGLLISLPGKLNLFHPTVYVFVVKMDVSILDEKYLLIGLSFCSKLDWVSYTLFLVLTLHPR